MRKPVQRVTVPLGLSMKILLHRTKSFHYEYEDPSYEDEDFIMNMEILLRQTKNSNQISLTPRGLGKE